MKKRNEVLKINNETGLTRLFVDDKPLEGVIQYKFVDIQKTLADVTVNGMDEYKNVIVQQSFKEKFNQTQDDIEADAGERRMNTNAYVKIDEGGRPKLVR